MFLGKIYPLKLYFLLKTEKYNNIGIWLIGYENRLNRLIGFWNIMRTYWELFDKRKTNMSLIFVKYGAHFGRIFDYSSYQNYEFKWIFRISMPEH